ncbi:hypothetical protein MMC11_005928 [Xylographa trunciseda]|nr:hypothetical protein [Xylographa trunciseda]
MDSSSSPLLTSPPAASPPSTSPPSPEHQQLLKHINTTHPETLARFLEHYATAFDAQRPRLIAITPSSLTIAYTNGTASSFILHSTKSIPLSPPLPSLSIHDVEARLLAMDAECEAAIERGGRSEVALTEYRAPRGLELAAAVFIASVMGAYGVEKFGAKGWRISELLGLGERWGGRYKWGLGVTFWVVVVLHVGENAGILLPLLWKYNVKVGTGLWWRWVGSHWVEGWGAIMRLKGMVREAEARRVKEGKKE